VNIVSTISGNTLREVNSALLMPASHPTTTELPIDNFIITQADQADHETNDRIEALPSPSYNLELIWLNSESEHEHDDPVDPMTEHDSPVPPDHITESEVTSHEISTDSSIDLDDALQGNEVIDLEHVQNNLSRTVNIAQLYARIVVFGYSIWVSAVAKPKPSLRSSLYRICIMMRKFLMFSRISKCDIDQI
jgi:hypothetical protein